MKFQFDIDKTIAAVAYLTEREGGELDMFLGLKMLYLADKEALVRWGKPITGDSFVALPKGPVLREVYDLFKGFGPDTDQKEWDAAFSERVNHSIHLLKRVDVGVLSEREMEILDEARQQIHKFEPWEVPAWLHQTCPEWKDPHGSSAPIDPEEILRRAGRTPEEIETIKDSNYVSNYVTKLLGAR